MDRTEPVVVRPVRIEDLPALNEAVNSVCRERRFLCSFEGFPLDAHRRFLAHVVRLRLPQVLACASDRVVGWCDILPAREPGLDHVGRLGIGVVKGYRRRGIGRRLLRECLEWAQVYGLEKVELEVFSDNIAAIALYRAFGFEREGLRRKARRIDGAYQDILMMALDLTCAVAVEERLPAWMRGPVEAARGG